MTSANNVGEIGFIYLVCLACGTSSRLPFDPIEGGTWLLAIQIAERVTHGNHAVGADGVGGNGHPVNQVSGPFRYVGKANDAVSIECGGIAGGDVHDGVGAGDIGIDRDVDDAGNDISIAVAGGVICLLYTSDAADE